MPVGYQLVLRAEEDQVLAPDVATRRAVAGTIRRIGRKHGLFGYGLADTHGHLGLLGDRSEAGRCAHDLRLALAGTVAAPLSTLAVHPIRDVWHAESTLAYMHRQDAHHGVGADPLREGTSLPDLCGLRPDGLWLADRVRAFIPRITRAELLRQWGIGELLEAFELGDLADAEAAAAGLGVLRGKTPAVVEARVACVHAAPAAGARALAETLEISERSVARLRRENADPRWVRAVRLQMGLRVVVRSSEGRVAALG